uniref:Uncharacterized protein n=1 Tax=Myotis myotis TaxID=51298 RepID=A0A7J7WVT6_MYOMY|nr:hypothetical protein mMyoMyo1_011966 [Myotis myotis]
MMDETSPSPSLAGCKGNSSIIRGESDISAIPVYLFKKEESNSTSRILKLVFNFTKLRRILSNKRETCKLTITPTPFPLANQQDMQINCQPRWWPAATQLKRRGGLLAPVTEEANVPGLPLPASELHSKQLCCNYRS